MSESTLQKGDFVRHEAEGWYGLVVGLRERDERGDIYRVIMLEQSQFCRANEFQKVPIPLDEASATRSRACQTLARLSTQPQGSNRRDGLLHGSHCHVRSALLLFRYRP